jgi:nitric oxide reductase large subunit
MKSAVLEKKIFKKSFALFLLSKTFSIAVFNSRMFLYNSYRHMYNAAFYRWLLAALFRKSFQCTALAFSIILVYTRRFMRISVNRDMVCG